MKQINLNHGLNASSKTQLADRLRGKADIIEAQLNQARNDAQKQSDGAIGDVDYSPLIANNIKWVTIEKIDLCVPFALNQLADELQNMHMSEPLSDYQFQEILCQFNEKLCVNMRKWLSDVDNSSEESPLSHELAQVINRRSDLFLGCATDEFEAVASGADKHHQKLDNAGQVGLRTALHDQYMLCKRVENWQLAKIYDENFDYVSESIRKLIVAGADMELIEEIYTLRNEAIKRLSQEVFGAGTYRPKSDDAGLTLENYKNLRNLAWDTNAESFLDRVTSDHNTIILNCLSNLREQYNVLTNRVWDEVSQKHSIENAKSHSR